MSLGWKDWGVLAAMLTAFMAVAGFFGVNPAGTRAAENRVTRIEMSQESTQRQLEQLASLLATHLDQTTHGYERLAVQEARATDLHRRLAEVERRVGVSSHIIDKDDKP